MPQASPARILIVDDDEGLARLVQKALERERYVSATAGSGQEAREWLGAGNRADLMLLDLKLPDVEGKELITQLTEAGSTVPFIIITGQGDERVAVEMMKTGALDYLVKDVQFLEFVPTVVRRALDQIERDRRLALAEKEARLAQTLVEQAYSAALVTDRDASDPRIMYFNPAFGQLLGCAPEKLIGRRLSELEQITGRFEPLRRVLASGESFVGEAHLRCASGEQLCVDCNIVKVFDHSGTQTHWAAILRDVTERKKLEREILEISDQEQRRIGLDLHDGLGQQLTGLEFFIVGLKEEITANHPQIGEALDKVGQQLREAIAQARAMASGLSPVALHRDSLISALSKLAESTREMTRAKCTFSHHPNVALPGAGSATQLYRIAQEAVNNALKHGKARIIAITLEDDAEGGLQLSVSDNGQGFDLHSRAEGLGLRAMRYRADLIGASLKIDSTPRKGTRVTCTLPRGS